MDVSEIRLKLFQQIDKIDPTKLEALYGVVQNYLQGHLDTEEWNYLTTAQQHGIEQGFSELGNIKGVPDSIVMEELRKKYEID